MRLIKQNDTTKAILFLLVSDTDHITAVTGASPTVTISKNGGTFAAPSGTITEISDGWYKLTPAASDVNTLGPLLIHATATGADPVDLEYQVVAYDPYSVTNLGLTNLDATVSSRSSHSPTDVRTEMDTNSTKLANLDATITSRQPAGAVDLNADQSTVTIGTVNALGTQAKLDVNNEVDSALNTAIPTTPTTGSINEHIKNLTPTRSTNLDNLDATISSVKSDTTAILDDTGTSGVVIATGQSVASVDSLGTQAKTDVNNEVTSVFNTAVPTTPTADSPYERLKTLDDNYTTSRASNLDNLDTTVSSRQASGPVDLNTDQSTVTIGTVNSLGTQAKTDVTNSVWDAAKSTHTAAGSFGEEVQTHATSSEIPTASSVASAVWDEATASHTSAGTTGKALSDVLDDTGTSGVVIADGAIKNTTIAQDALEDTHFASSALTKIAVWVWRTTYNTIRTATYSGLPTLIFRSGIGALARLVNKNDASDGISWKTYHEDDISVFESTSITTSANADVITASDPS